ncbi:hypothetical protein ELI_1378 [Eubacterium callanderi]|uniref:Uncharacterized protein n=1 Tax=Eubacterium callanderi TaxID=53442 RepID=E3GL73_9FIRM|nr:hypothetical protein ELI_1378 [Eubacterium callanderi]
MNKSKITALSFCLRDSPENRGYTFGALLKETLQSFVAS